MPPSVHLPPEVKVNTFRNKPLTSLFVRPRLTLLVSNERHVDLEAVTELIETEQPMPSIDTTHTLNQAADAMRHLETGTVCGKISIVLESTTR